MTETWFETIGYPSTLPDKGRKAGKEGRKEERKEGERTKLLGFDQNTKIRREYVRQDENM